LPNHHPTLAELLSARGYETAAFVAAPALDRWYGLAKGFRTYDDRMDQYQGLAMRRADAIADAGIRWLESLPAGARWFCFLHFFDAHWPYVSKDEQGDAANCYEAGLRLSDRHLGRVIDWLRLREQFDDTLIVVFGDHGEDLAGAYANDRGGAALGHPEEEGHGCLLYQTTQHVPLIFAHRSLPTRRWDSLTGLVDITPTICALVGAIPPLRCDGIDLSNQYGAGPANRPALYAETLYPGDLAERDPRLSHLQNLQARWLDHRTKIIRAWAAPDAALAFDLIDDPLEHRPAPAPASAASIFWPDPS
jgi:arylsulfatase A-like enzyme